MTPLAAALAVALAACGGSSSQEDATADAIRRARIAVSVTPSADVLATKASQQFAATVTNTSNTAVIWTVQEGAPGGGVDSSGLYTAPSSPGTFHVVATSVANPNKSGTAAVTVTTTGIAVAVSPASASIATGATQQFSASVSGTTNGSVSWTVQEGAAGGAVTSTGLYTAPSAAGSYHVVATSQADGTTSAVATVTVAAPVVAVAVSPATASIATGATQQLSATVSGTTNGSVSWTVQEGAAGGAVSSTGLYTAPSAAGTYHVVATSQADSTKSAVATVTVRVPSSGTLGDAPAWVAALPLLSNGLPWNPGVPGGIPAGTVDTTLTSSQMTASAINSALSAASARGSPTNIRVVVMPAGTFSISGAITPQNYTILRGAGASGAGRTRLNFGASGGILKGEVDWTATPTPANLAIAAGATLPVGSSAIPVSSTTAFAVGDLVQIDQLDDLSYVAILDAGYEKRAPFTDGPYHGPISTGGLRSVGSQHVVTAISGSTLTVDPPTRIDYTYYSKADGTTRLMPQVWRVARRGTTGLWYFGFEQASIAGPQNTAIWYTAGAYNWVKDVETDGSTNGGISNDHVLFDHQFRSEIRRVYAHHTTGGPIQGGANYGIDLSTYTSDSLVIDSISTYMNKPVVTNCAGPGNVIAYNYVDNTSANGGAWMDGAIDGSHQSFTHNLLVEGNWTANMGTDATHGVSGFMAFVRNYSPGKSTNYANNNNLRCANADGWTRETAFLGNVLNPPSGAVYEATGAVVGGQYSVWSIGQNVWGVGDDYDSNTGGGTYNTVIGGVAHPPQNAFSYGTFSDNRQATFTSNARSKLFRHGNWDSVHQSIYDWNAAFPAHAVADSWFLTSAPAFFGAKVWPWIDPTGATAAARVGTLPAKARYDAGTPFAP